MDFFHWAHNEDLKAAAEALISGKKLATADAISAVRLLEREGARLIRKRVGNDFYDKHFPTHRNGGLWKQDNPVGVVDHYTAGVSSASTLRWFSNRDRGDGYGTSSAHYVMDRNGATIQLIDPTTTVAWHARSFSRSHVGIEHVNAGLLRKVDGRLRFQNVHNYPSDRTYRVQEIDGEFWEPYTIAQVVNNVFLKRLLLDAIPTLSPEHFVDHQQIDPERKTDCGPLWPLFSLNRLAVSRAPVTDMLWLGEEYLTQVGVFEFTREVDEYLASL